MALSKTTNRYLKPLFKRLGPKSDSFERSASKLIHRPVKELVGGFHFDYSSVERRWLHFFVEPLYVPPSGHLEGFNLDWGYRLPVSPPLDYGVSQVTVVGNEAELDETIQVLEDQGLTLLLPLLEPAAFLEFLLDEGAPYLSTSFRHKALATSCTAMLIGDRNLALQLTEKAVLKAREQKFIVDDPRDQMPQADWSLRCTRDLLNWHQLLLEGSNSNLAQQLKAWEWHNRKVKGLEQISDPAFLDPQSCLM